MRQITENQTQINGASLEELRLAQFTLNHVSRPTHKRGLYLGVYAVDRRYGGPEEGGWWYDTAQYLGRSIPATTEHEYTGDDPAIAALREKLEAEYTDSQPRYPLDSVLSDGPEIRVYVEEKPGDQEDLKRQTYS